MLLAGLERLETEFFRGLNQFVEPMVRAGLGAPVLFPAGAIVIEINGRKTGRVSKVPLIAALVGELVVVGTVRRRSNTCNAPSCSEAMRATIFLRPSSLAIENSSFASRLPRPMPR